MNVSHDLKAKLSAQRKWRETQMPIQKPGRWKSGVALFTMLAVFASALIALAMIYAAYVLAPKETSMVIGFTKIPHAAAYVLVSGSPSPAPIHMSVCTANLHVRFTPNGDVRGYLKQGEQVTLALDAQGKPDIKLQDKEKWILVAAPVAGWANTKFLCQQKGDNHE